MDVTVASLRAAARRQAAALDPRGAAQLAAYVIAFEGQARRHNLTGAAGRRAVLEVLVEPSFAVARAWPTGSAPHRVLDLGSGNGFPGVVAAVLWPDARVWLVERRARKAAAIATCLRAAHIENAASVPCDARELRRERPDVPGTIDLVTLRAVGRLAPTTRLAAPLLAEHGRIVHFKSDDLSTDERSEGVRAAALLGLEVLEDVRPASGRGRLIVYARPGVAA